MSASERLKALGDELPRERITEHIMAEGWNPDWATPQKLQDVSRELRLAAYDDALPQIVALAKAAELVRSTQPRGDFDIHTLHQALEDLDEALGGDVT